MVENPKLNLFDIWLDAIETKIGFGSEANIKPKDLDLYFSYCIAANLNGYKFYSVTTTIALTSIAFSQYFVDDFPRTKTGVDQFMVFLIAINMVWYVFASRIKVFPPDMDIKDSFNRFIALFFNIYEYLLTLYAVHLTKEQRIEIQVKLMTHADIFFCLYDIYALYNTLLVTPHSSDADQIDRLLKQEPTKKKTSQTKFNEFFASYDTYKYESSLRGFEDVLFDSIMPAEIMIKLLYNRQDVFTLSEHVVPAVYKKKDIDPLIAESLTRSPWAAEKLLELVMDHKYWKESFFESVKTMMITKHRKSPLNGDMIEQLFSHISDGSSWVSFPEGMLQDGALMDRMLNFYVWLMGTYRVGRGDSLYIRYMRKGLLSVANSLHAHNRSSINYCNALLHMRNKNSFFCKIIFDGVRSWKQSFIVPFVAEVKEVYQYGYVMDQMLYNALSIIYQDILPKDIRLSIHHKSLTLAMQRMHGKKLLLMIWLNTVSFLEEYYKPIDELLSYDFICLSAIAELKDGDITSLKESLYSLEYRLVRDFLQLIHSQSALAHFDDIVIVHLISIIKDTLVGMIFLLHVALAKEKKNWTSAYSDQLIALYIKDVLMLDSEFISPLSKLIYALYELYLPLIEIWITIDDNQYFIEVGVDCWYIFSTKQEDHHRSITTEDALWFRGYLKHITYYNKRYVTPRYK